METFRNLALAYETLRAGGNKSCILNAANEVVVAAFLADKIGFLEMSDVIESTLEKVEFIANPTLEDYLETDRLARLITKEIIKD
ncbi:1-deoxy-D-xylulose 5-phosphate reductoisomerase [compost metagenome]